jgi:hypothetical protein
MPSDAAVLFVRPGSVRPSDKAKLSKAGIIVVEMDDPSSAKFVSATPPFQELATGTLLAAFAKAIKAGDSGNTKAALANAISAAVILQHEKPTP